MKNKLILAGVLILAMAVVFKVGKVLGEGGTLMVCKTNGGILMARENCPSGMQTYGLAVGSGGGGVIPTSGDIAFVDDGTVLKKDGRVWTYDEIWNENTQTGIYGWTEDLLRKIPTEVSVNNIIQWTNKSFITNSGKYYIYEFQVGSYYWTLMNIATTMP